MTLMTTAVMRDALFVGLDLGTSSLKAVAVGAGGEVAARAHASYPTARPEPAAAEQSPADWWTAVESAVAALRAGGAPAERWAAIGLSGMIPTLVVTDDDGEPVAPAITWEDGRAEAEGEALRARLGGERLYGLTGQWVDGRYLLPMYLRSGARRAAGGATRAPAARRQGLAVLAAHRRARDRPEHGQRLRLLRARDGIVARRRRGGGGVELASLNNWPRSGPIVQRSAKDTGTAERAGAIEGGGGTQHPDTGVARACRPCHRYCLRARPGPVEQSGERLGLPAGLPVCLGGADSVLGCLGLGVSRPGDVACVAGTSTVLLGVADQPRRRSRASLPHHAARRPRRAGASRWTCSRRAAPSAGSRGCCARPAATRRRSWPWRRASSRAPAALSFLPYLAPGEQGALWDPTISGTLFGLSLGHGAADVARALVDGVVLESRRCLAVLDQAGLPRGAVRMAGAQRRRPDLSPAARRRLPAHGRLRRRRRDGPLGDRGGGGCGRGRRPRPPARRRSRGPRDDRARRGPGGPLGRAVGAPRGRVARPAGIASARRRLASASVRRARRLAGWQVR